ncbi:unnamed protein product [Clonostachys solani]|uniref:Uncharacterized protein n=1 Tax=Clonostachys solani TaxID=160281 RepID=A0A9N9ZBC4_9HYPO|nr:unnamed protein product [Clonostachys solani]
MTEIAAGMIAVEQLVATGVEAAAAASLARPGQLTKASLSQIAIEPSNQTSVPSLARSHHTLTVINEAAFIFGGKGSGGKLCSTDVHEVLLPINEPPKTRHELYQPVGISPVAPLPVPRFSHAACARGNELVIHGGRNEEGAIADDGHNFWLWNSELGTWSRTQSVNQPHESPLPRYGHSIFFDKDKDLLILHGGEGVGLDEDVAETWVYSFAEAKWTRFPSLPVKVLGATWHGGTLYSVGSESHRIVHTLQIDTSSLDPSQVGWTTLQTATSSVPGGQSRVGAALLPFNTTMGRCYLLQLFGINRGGAVTEHGSAHKDILSLQVPSTALSGSGIKDTIRDALPQTESGSLSWAEIEPSPTDPPSTQIEGKAYPDARSFFGAADYGDGKRVILWGGVDAYGDLVGDGWIVNLE